MHRSRIIQLTAGSLALLSLFIAGLLGPRINASAARHQLVYVDRAEENAPPQVALGIAMGALRGVFVNYLWIRANKLKEEGKFHESMTLARAITTLQPRFPEVWTFHAWNMAYNISVSANTREERWEWVNKGIRLLRDEGIVYNPNALLIHRELSWIFLHKIAGFTDDANQYYKRALAAEWTEVLGEPPVLSPTMRRREDAISVFVDWLQPIADAPRSVRTLLVSASDDETRQALQRLIDTIEGGAADDLAIDFLRRYTQMHAILESSYRNLAVNMSEEARALRPRATLLRDLLLDPQYDAAFELLLPYVRRKVLTEDYHMEPQRMIRYTKKYGPLDWRHPAAHSLYWAAKGVEATFTRIRERTTRDYDFVNADRHVIQSLQELYRSGQLYFSYVYWTTPQLRLQDEGGANVYSLYLAVPNAHFVEMYGEIVVEVAKRSKYDQTARIWGLYDGGYENFLKDAIRFFYRRGQKDVAQRYLFILINRPTLSINDEWKNERYIQTLEEFINDQFEDERFKSTYVAQSEVSAAIQAAVVALLEGNAELFRSNWEYAKLFHQKYTEAQVEDMQTQTGSESRRTEVMDREWPFYAGTHVATFVSMLDIEQAERVYLRAPDQLKNWIYTVMADRVGFSTNQQTALGGRDFQEVFPEPEGYEQFRLWYENALRTRAARGPNQG